MEIVIPVRPPNFKQYSIIMNNMEQVNNCSFLIGKNVKETIDYAN